MDWQAVTHYPESSQCFMINTSWILGVNPDQLDGDSLTQVTDNKHPVHNGQVSDNCMASVRFRSNSDTSADSPSPEQDPRPHSDRQLASMHDKHDPKYLERRRRNNLAARKSRNTRKVRINQLKIKLLCLENANHILRQELEAERRLNRDLRTQLEPLMAVDPAHGIAFSGTQAGLFAGSSTSMPICVNMA